VQRQAVTALAKLHEEIRKIESELSLLRKQEEQIGMLTGAVSPRAAAADGASGSRGRINWRAVLAKVPKRFKASDVRSVRGLANKRSAEIFAAVTRWIDGGLVKRKERGVYERVG
jgi:hypothetical protein